MQRVEAPDRAFHRTRIILHLAMLLSVAALPKLAVAQTDCAEGDGVLETDKPKDIAVPDLIQKIAANESQLKEALTHYTLTRDLMVQTLDGKAVDGQFHEVATVSYDPKGRRQENVTYGEVSTLRGVQLSAEDWDDIRVFMPWMMTTAEVPDYNITYAGRQHVDDLETYVFHVEPKKEEKNKRYYQGRIWVDSRDLQIVKLCGKSVPEQIHVKKHQSQDIRPTFVTYRQLVDGHWFPAYVRVDDTLHFTAQTIQIREIVKFKDYKQSAPAKP